MSVVVVGVVAIASEVVAVIVSVVVGVFVAAVMVVVMMAVVDSFVVSPTALVSSRDHRALALGVG